MVIVMAVGSTEAAQANPVGGRGKVQSKCLRLRVGEQEVQVQLAEWRVAHAFKPGFAYRIIVCCLQCSVLLSNCGFDGKQGTTRWWHNCEMRVELYKMRV